MSYNFRQRDNLNAHPKYDDYKTNFLPTVVDQEPDDFDWLPHVPGRPAPYSNTWSQVYGGRKPNSTNTGFDVPCAEGIAIKSGCSGNIELNSLNQELNAQSTPKGRLQKPPVCHIVPWSVLSMVLTQQYGGASENFKRHVCWGVLANLRTGHNGCNSQQSHVTAQNATSSDIKQGEIVVQMALNTYPGQNYKL